MNINYCECCGEYRKVRAVCIDDNMDCELCPSCIADLRAIDTDVQVLAS